MSRKRTVLGIALFLLTFVAGFAVGSRGATRFFLGALENEVTGSLDGLVETLSALRMDEAELLIEPLEARVTSAVRSLPQERPWEEIPPATRQALLVAKRYLELYPPAAADESLTEALAAIPDQALDPAACSPAVRRLLGVSAPG